MGWNLYSIKFKLKSPLYIGFHKVMHFFRTRLYVPAKPFWGALTAKLTRRLNLTDYGKVGEFLKKTIRFSYFYLSDENNVFIPRYTIKGMKFGDLMQMDFEKRYISSIASAAIESYSHTAEEGMLHEVEFISPNVINDGKSVFLKGLLWILEFSDNRFSIFINDDDIIIEYNNNHVKFSELINTLQIGGERKYGFGFLKIEGKPKKESYNDLTKLGFFGKWKENGNEILLLVKKDDPIWSHVKYSSDLMIKGCIEPIVGRDWNNKGAGKKLSVYGLYWAPGSILMSEETFKITPNFGLWVKE
ncbi:MAG: RAMP superfamily CRISPR-associated protein [Candidatus Helarchaeota archaeon]